MAAGAFGALATRLAGANRGAASLLKGPRAPRGAGNFNPPVIRGLTRRGIAANAGGLQSQQGAQALRPTVPQVDAGQAAQGGRILAPGTPGQPPGTPTPGAPGAKPPGTPAPPQPQLDSTALANIAAYDAKANNAITGTQLSEANAGTQLQSQLAQLDYAQPRASLALEEAANNRGGLYSSVYGQQLGDSNYKFAGQRGGLAQAYANNMANWENAIAGDQSGILTYAGQQAADSAARAAALAAANPGAGLMPAPTHPGAAPAPVNINPPSVGSTPSGGGRFPAGGGGGGSTTASPGSKPSGGGRFPAGGGGGGRLGGKGAPKGKAAYNRPKAPSVPKSGYR